MARQDVQQPPQEDAAVQRGMRGDGVGGRLELGQRYALRLARGPASGSTCAGLGTQSLSKNSRVDMAPKASMING